MAKEKIRELKHAVNKDLFELVRGMIHCSERSKGGKCEGCDHDADFVIMAFATEMFNDKEFKELEKSNPKQAQKLKDRWL